MVNGAASALYKHLSADHCRELLEQSVTSLTEKPMADREVRKAAEKAFLKIQKEVNYNMKTGLNHSP